MMECSYIVKLVSPSFHVWYLRYTLDVLLGGLIIFQVIEMSGVCAASDIWSVGCTVIELLTCVPPYYDLQPMPALYRIVQVCLDIYISAIL